MMNELEESEEFAIQQDNWLFLFFFIVAFGLVLGIKNYTPTKTEAPVQLNETPVQEKYPPMHYRLTN